MNEPEIYIIFLLYLGIYIIFNCFGNLIGKHTKIRNFHVFPNKVTATHAKLY